MRKIFNKKGAVRLLWRAVFLAFCLLFHIVPIFAQVQIKGVVTDANTGEPLPGVSIQAEGATTGSITGVDGKYSLTLPEGAKVLVFSYVGYISEKVNVEGKSQADVAMIPDIKMMDEIVVIGYGTSKRRDLTGTVTSITDKDIKNIPVATTEQALTGRLAGVQITSTDGAPDAEMIVRVRGGGSITGDNSPLYIVDGFPVASLNYISVNDIQSIDVLKDASSTAIYGARGANGVVLVTTKSAKSGKTTVSYNNFFQSKKLTRKLDVMSPYEFVLFNYEYAALRGTTSTDYSNFMNKYGVWGDLDLYKYQKGHDFQEDMFGATATSLSHNLSINGGSEKTKFALSSTYNKDNGLMKSNNYSRLNLNFKLTHEISKKLSFNFNARVADIVTNGSGTSGGLYKIRSSQAITRSAVEGLEELVDINSMTEEEYERYLENHTSLTELAQQYWRKKLDRNYNVTSAITWEIVKGLSFRTQFGYDMSFDQLKRYYGPKTTQAFNDGQSLPIVNWIKENQDKYQVTNLLTYKFKPHQNHDFEAMVGQEFVSGSKENNFMQAKFFSAEMPPEKIFANIGLSTGANNFSSSSYVFPDDRMASFFGRLNYTIKDRYLATLVLRTDGTTKFASKNRWAAFPAAALAWRISEEDFMKGQKIVSNLKVRFSYGVAGNNNIGSAQYQYLYKIAGATDYGNSNGKAYGIGDIVNSYYIPFNTQLPNPDLKWETNYTRNIGLDFGLFNDKINGTLDAYMNSTKNLLIQTKIVAPGYTDQQQNIGQTSNKGIELTLNGNIINTKDFNLSATFNISINRPNVDKLASGLTEQSYNSGWAGTDIKGSDDYRVIVGKSLGNIYGFVTDGFYTTDDFDAAQSVNGKFVLNPGVASDAGLIGSSFGVRPGTIKFKDLDGDGEITTTGDRKVIGNTTPKHIGGFSLNGSYKGFDMSVYFNWVYGNDIYNANKIASTQNWRYSYPNLLNMMNSSHRYTYLDASGQVVTDLATLKDMNEVGSNKKDIWSPHFMGSAVVVPHSWAIEDGSYLRLQNITLGYTLPGKITKRVGIQQFRVFGTLNNVWVWTKYSGYDPEVSTPIRNENSSSITPGSSSYNSLTPGVDFSAYPKSFSYTFGLNIPF